MLTKEKGKILLKVFCFNVEKLTNYKKLLLRSTV